jgi:hypothetical protein
VGYLGRRKRGDILSGVFAVSFLIALKTYTISIRAYIISLLIRILAWRCTRQHTAGENSFLFPA